MLLYIIEYSQLSDMLKIRQNEAFSIQCEYGFDDVFLTYFEPFPCDTI